MLTTIITLTLVIAAVAAGASYFVGGAISAPVVAMTEAMQKLASGDLKADIPSRRAKR